MIDGFFAFIAFVVNLIFFFWFGSRLNSISRNLAAVAEQSVRQTRLLASLANTTAEAVAPQPTVREDGRPKKQCINCQAWVPESASACSYCGKWTDR
jgi:hypothetical protein